MLLLLQYKEKIKVKKVARNEVYGCHVCQIIYIFLDSKIEDIDLKSTYMFPSSKLRTTKGHSY